MPDYEFMRRARTPPCRRLPCDPAARSAGVGRLLPFAKPSGGNRPGRQEAPRRMTTQKKRAPRRKHRGKSACSGARRCKKARRDTKAAYFPALRGTGAQSGENAGKLSIRRINSNN